MKRYLSVLFLSLFLAMTATAQIEEGDDNLIVHGQLGYFSGAGDDLTDAGAYESTFNPGFEVMYQYYLTDNLAFASGINYQGGKISTLTETKDRFKFGEVSMPLLFRYYRWFRPKNAIFYSAGICPGIIAGNTWHRTTGGGAWTDVEERFEDFYKEGSFFLDLHVDFGYYQPIGALGALTISPYVKYKVADNWMGHYKNKTSFGVKIGYHILFAN